MYKGDAGLVKTIRTPPTNKVTIRSDRLKPYTFLVTTFYGNLFQLLNSLLDQ